MLEEQREQSLQTGPGSLGFPWFSGGRAQHVLWVFQVLLDWQQESVLGAGMAVVRFMCFPGISLLYVCLEIPEETQDHLSMRKVAKTPH